MGAWHKLGWGLTHQPPQAPAQRSLSRSQGHRHRAGPQTSSQPRPLQGTTQPREGWAGGRGPGVDTWTGATRGLGSRVKLAAGRVGIRGQPCFNVKDAGVAVTLAQDPS